MSGRLTLLFPLVFLAAGCPAIPEDGAKEAIQKSFNEHNPPGRTGMELLGKAVWLKGPAFEEACITGADLAFPDDPKGRPKSDPTSPRISPTYQAQRWITGSTPKGWCVYMGEDPTLSMGEGKWEDGAWQVPVTFGMKKPSPWFGCLPAESRQRVFSVKEQADGKVMVDPPVALFPGNPCPSPLAGGEERKAASRPVARPPAPPAREKVIALLRAFDDALFMGEYLKALDMVSCYNLFEESKYGTCSVAELIAAGPMPRGSARPFDGPPWLEYVIDDPSKIGRIVPDRDDPTLFHVQLQPMRGGKDRSLSVQWVEGHWRLVGVVGQKAEAITTMRFVYDLDRPDKRAIFERRMKGEAIDEKGFPLNPEAEPADAKK